jgi:spheroidene monooxygenase
VPEAVAAGTSGPRAGSGTDPAATSVALVLAVWRPAYIAWGLAQLIQGPLVQPSAPTLRWRKVLGSGHEGGFGLRPAWNRLGLFCAFDQTNSAREWLAESDEVARWKDRAEQWLTVLLEPLASRGSWSGHSLAVAQPDAASPSDSMVASLTRASIRPRLARRFWSLSPAAEVSLAQAPGCLFAVGLGEAPLLRQATFSLWHDQPAMDAYARSGAHLEAIRQAYSQGFFSESMFTRFRVLEIGGHWPQASPALGERLDSTV